MWKSLGWNSIYLVTLSLYLKKDSGLIGRALLMLSVVLSLFLHFYLLISVDMMTLLKRSIQQRSKKAYKQSDITLTVT